MSNPKPEDHHHGQHGHEAHHGHDAHPGHDAHAGHDAHQGPGHDAHAGHASHGVMHHAPPADVAEQYRAAAAAAQPDAGRRVVVIELEARETPGAIGPGFTAWTYNGQVPGPTLEARA